jgi:hypothetical protein
MPQDLNSLDNPTTSRWSHIQPLEGDVAQTLEDVKQTVDPVFTALTTILEIVKGVLDVTVNLLLDFTDPNKLAVKAAIEAIRTIINDLVGEAGFYFISIPIIPIDRPLANKILYERNPGEGLVESLEPLAVAVADDRIGGGGNYGFLSVLAESMNDADDPFRPTFDEDAHVAGVVIMFGAESYLKVAALVNKLANLLGGPKKTGPSEGIKSSSDFPKPKNLTATLGPSSKTSAKAEQLKNWASPDGVYSPYAVKLEWDLENEVHVLPWPNEDATGLETWKITHVMVYRSDKPISTSITLDALEELKIAEYEFSGWTSDFYDDGVELGKTWYYAVGYKMVEILQEAGGGFSELVSEEPQPFNIMTTQIAIPEDPNMFARKGVPPDWFVISSPLAAIPAVQQTVDRILKILDTIEKTIDDKSAKMRKFIQAIESEINRYVDWVQDIVDTVEQLIDSLNWTGIYAGITGFQGKGGNDFFLNQLGTALNDTNDPNRPPFDKGTEAVCGFVMYAGSTTAGALEKFIAQTELLWGINIAQIGEYADTVSNAYNDAVAAIDVAIEEIQRQICLSDNLRDLIDCPADEELGQALNAQLEPAAEAEGCEG